MEQENKADSFWATYTTLKEALDSVDDNQPIYEAELKKIGVLKKTLRKI